MDYEKKEIKITFETFGNLRTKAKNAFGKATKNSKTF